jgi:hypothetical protein
MNSLEYIDKQILFVKQNIQYHKDLLTTTNDNESIEIIKSTIKLLEPDLQTLQQIKSELEAWYELNKLFVIKPYYQDKENNKHPAIMIQHRVEHDFEYVRRGVKQKSFNIIEKALEVKNVD